MRWKLLLGAVVLAAGLYLIVSPSFKQEEQDLISGKRPVEILEEVEQKNNLKSYNYRTRVRGGSIVSIDLMGKVANDTEEQLLDLSWESPQGNGEALAFLKGNQILVFHPRKNRWLKPEDEPTLRPLIEMAGSQLPLLDPYQSLQRINFAEAKIENTGIEQVRDMDTTVIEVEPGAKAGEWFKGVLPPQLVGAKVSEVKQIYWVGNKDLRIYKYLMTAKIKVLALQLFEVQILSAIEDHNETELHPPKALQEKIDQEGL